MPGISVSKMKAMRKTLSSREGEQGIAGDLAFFSPAHLFSCSPALSAFGQSGWADSNRRPSDPQSDALTKLRYSPSSKPRCMGREQCSRVSVTDQVYPQIPRCTQEVQRRCSAANNSHWSAPCPAALLHIATLGSRKPPERSPNTVGAHPRNSTPKTQRHHTGHLRPSDAMPRLGAAHRRLGPDR